VATLEKIKSEANVSEKLERAPIGESRRINSTMIWAPREEGQHSLVRRSSSSRV